MALFEGSKRNHRIEFIPETTLGTTPANPAWELFSDSVLAMDIDPNPNLFERRNVGSPDVQEFRTGPEDLTFTVRYHLQRWLVSGGNAQDAAGYGMLRNGDNDLPNGHTVVDREDHATGGVDSGGIRIFRVAKGALVNTVGLTLDPDTGEHIVVELGYICEKLRYYQVDQPNAATLLAVRSTDAADTTQSVTVEDQDAGTAETLSLNGTTLVSTSGTFADIDAIALDAEMVGDLEVLINTGSVTAPAAGSVLATIRGSDAYQGIEGDLGIPALGSGSHAAALGTAFEQFLGDLLERPGGTTLAANIRTAAITVENNIDPRPRHDSKRRRLIVGDRSAVATATVFGQTEGPTRLDELLRAAENSLVWTATGGTVTLTNAAPRSTSGLGFDVGDVAVEPAVEFVGQGLTIA